jgi:hypothetical protein
MRGFWMFNWGKTYCSVLPRLSVRTSRLLEGAEGACLAYPSSFLRLSITQGRESLHLVHPAPRFIAVGCPSIRAFRSG